MDAACQPRSHAPEQIRSGPGGHGAVPCPERVESSLAVSVARNAVSGGPVLGENKGRDRLMLHRIPFL